jgi:hypothetical protein
MMYYFHENGNAVDEAYANGWRFTPIGWNDGRMTACIGSTWIIL